MIAEPPPVASSQDVDHSRETASSPLAVSSYDRAAAGITSLLILLSIAAGLLLAMWLTHRLVLTTPAVEVELISDWVEQTTHAPGEARDLEPPGADEMQPAPAPAMAPSPEAVTEVISSMAASIPSLLDGQFVSSGPNGRGDNRRPGPHDVDGPPIVPPSERWQFQYPAMTLSQYAAALDHFQIELGALGGGSSQVNYASRFTKPVPDVRHGASHEEQRLFFVWTSGRLQAADRQLLGQAGIKTAGRIVAQFIPASTEALLANVEKRHANRPAEEIRRTIFGVRRTSSGFEFFVMSQDYR